MKPEDFLFIEKELNIKLPKEYIDMVLQNPFKDKKYQKVRNSLLFDINEIININKKLRETGYNNCPWSDKYFIIGISREDTYSFINLSQEENFKVYGVLQEDQVIGKPIKKVNLGSNISEYVEGKKIVAKCL